MSLTFTERRLAIEMARQQSALTGRFLVHVMIGGGEIVTVNLAHSPPRVWRYVTGEA